MTGYWRIFQVAAPFGALVTPHFGVMGPDLIPRGGKRPSAPWRPGKWTEAACGQDGGHPVPGQDCTCGVYAVPRRDELVRWLVELTQQPVTTIPGFPRIPDPASHTALMNRAMLALLRTCAAVAPVELDGDCYPVPEGKLPPDPPGTMRAARGRIPADAVIYASRPRQVETGIAFGLMAGVGAWADVRPLSELISGL